MLAELNQLTGMHFNNVVLDLLNEVVIGVLLVLLLWSRAAKSTQSAESKKLWKVLSVPLSKARHAFENPRPYPPIAEKCRKVVEPYGDLGMSAMQFIFALFASVLSGWIATRYNPNVPFWGRVAGAVVFVLAVRYSRAQLCNLLWALHDINNRDPDAHA